MHFAALNNVLNGELRVTVAAVMLLTRHKTELQLLMSHGAYARVYIILSLACVDQRRQNPMREVLENHDGDLRDETLSGLNSSC